MKKLTKISIIILSLLILFSTISFATETRSSSEPSATSENGTVVTNEDSTHSHHEHETNINESLIRMKDIYIGDTDVVISEFINGNAFIYGNNVTIKGQISGDLFVMADNLTIDSSAIIYNNIFALAKQITVKGQTSDIYALSENFTLSSEAIIARDVKLYSTSVSLEGTIGKDAYIAAESLTFPENASKIIRGDLHYTSTNEAIIPEGAVTGETKFTQIFETQPSAEEVMINYVITFISVVAFAALIIVLSNFVTPSFSSKANYCISKRPFSTATIGIFSTLFVPVVAFVLLLTGVLTYAGLALLIIYILALSITISFLGIAVGNYLARKLKNYSNAKSILLSILSVAIIWGLQQIPTVGYFISIFTVVFGFGIFIHSLFIKKDKIVEITTKKEDVNTN